MLLASRTRQFCFDRVRFLWKIKRYFAIVCKLQRCGKKHAALCNKAFNRVGMLLRKQLSNLRILQFQTGNFTNKEFAGILLITLIVCTHIPIWIDNNIPAANRTYNIFELHRFNIRKVKTDACHFASIILFKHKARIKLLTAFCFKTANRIRLTVCDQFFQLFFRKRFSKNFSNAESTAVWVIFLIIAASPPECCLHDFATADRAGGIFYDFGTNIFKIKCNLHLPLLVFL